MGALEPDSTFPAPRPDGQLWAVHVTPDGRVEDVADPGPPHEGWLWLHYDLASVGSGAGLARCELPDVVRSLFMDPDDGVQFQAEPEWLAGVVPDLEHGCDPGEFRTGALRFFLTPRRLVTARRTPLLSVHRVWRDLRTSPPPEGPEILMRRMRRAFVEELARLTTALQQELDAVEDDLLETKSRAHPQARAGPLLGRVRQKVARLQRVTKPLTRLHLDEEDELPAWTDRAVIRSTRRHTLAVLDDLQTLEDRSHALQDELNARQTEEANRRLYVLAIVTSLLAPTTLLTGFFGMNTGGLPWTSSPQGTWLALGLLVTTVGAMLWLLRRGGLL